MELIVRTDRTVDNSKLNSIMSGEGEEMCVLMDMQYREIKWDKSTS